MDKDDKIFPLLWNISDHFQIKDGVVIFSGSVSDVQEFKDMLTKLDPNACRGIE